MDRYAVFVDVGYLYAAGGTLCLGDKSRRNIDLDIASMVSVLAVRAAEDCGQRLLRTYWYDGARRGVPTPEHTRAGLVDDVKVRLGSINSAGQQKGVDALVYRDLMTLARERAITHAYLLAGDADLIEGVRAAQDMGTHVTLMHIDAGPGQGTSPDLMHESDRRIRLVKADLTPHFAARTMTGSGAIPGMAQVAAATTRAPTVRDVGPPAAGSGAPTPHASAAQPTAGRTVSSPPQSDPVAPIGIESEAVSAEGASVDPHPPVTGSGPAPVHSDHVTAESAARAFAQTWLDAALDHDVRALAVDRPKIPAPVDSALLRAVEAAVDHSLRTDEPLRRAARQAFWNAVHETVSV